MAEDDYGGDALVLGSLRSEDRPMRVRIGIYILLLMSCSAFSLSSGSPADVEWLKELGEEDTFFAATLNGAEQQQILEQVANSSFDSPDSWLQELRIRRVSMGESAGLVIRGTHLLCGATGNCETWIFRRAHDRWLNALDGEAPLASGFGFVRQTAAIKDWVIVANRSADAAGWTRYRFDGEFYRRIECFDVRTGAMKGAAQKVPCT